MNINIKSLSEKRENLIIINELNLTVKENKITTITGPSGCGKTTLLYSMMGLSDSASGEIIYGDTDILSMSSKEKTDLRRTHVGYVPQDSILIEDLTVRENLLIPLEHYKIDGKEKRKRIAKAIKLVNLTNYENKKAGSLSGGEKQRVAIARAIVHDPSVILADEPTASVDAKNRESIISIFHELCAKGKTIVIITHDEYVMKNSDVTFNLAERRSIQHGNLQKHNNSQASTTKSLILKSKINWMFFSFRNIKRKKTQSMFFLGIVSVILMFSYFIFGINGGLVKQLEAMSNQTDKKVLVMSDEQRRSGEDFRNDCNSALLNTDNELKTLETINFTSPFIKFIVENKEYKLNNMYGNIISELPEINQSLPQSQKTNIITGSVTNNGIVIPEPLAKQIGVDYKSIIGKNILLEFNNGTKMIFLVSGIIKSDGITTKFPIYTTKNYYKATIPKEIMGFYQYVAETKNNVKEIDIENLFIQKNIKATNPYFELKNFLDTMSTFRVIMILISVLFTVTVSIFITFLAYINATNRKKEFSIFSVFGYSIWKNSSIFLIEYMSVFFLSIVITGVAYKHILEPQINSRISENLGLENVLNLSVFNYLLITIIIGVFLIVSLIIPIRTILKNNVYKSLQ